MSSLLTSIPFTVFFRADKGGGKETVSLRELEIEPLYEFCQYVSEYKTPQLVKLCTGKDSAWLNRLELASFAALAKACIELNFQNAVTLMQSDPVIAVKLAPIVRKMLEVAVSTNLDTELLDRAKSLLTQLNAPANAGAPSSSSSSPPAPSASAAETGAASSAPTPSAG